MQFLFASEVLARPDYGNLVFDPVPISAADVQKPQLPVTANFLHVEEFIPSSSPDSGLNSHANAVLNDLDLSAAISERLDRIDATIDNTGPYSKIMQSELAALARLYQDADKHDKALDAFDQAIHLSKIHHGLFHEAQVPLIESSIQSLLSLGRNAEVSAQLEFLIYLHEKHYGADSKQLIHPLANKVAWDMYMYEQNALSGRKHADQVVLLNGIATAGMPGAGQSILHNTQKVIIKGIQILVNARDFGNPFLYQFERQLIETYFHLAYDDGQARSDQHQVAALDDGNLLGSGSFDYALANYQNGEKAYQRLLTYLENSGQGHSMEFVLTTLGLGDWYMLFNKHDKGREQYHKACLLLDNSTFSDTDKLSILQPAVPVELPAFDGMLRFSAVKKAIWKSETHADYKGFVDVSLALSKYGRVSELEVLGQSPETPGYIVSELQWKLRDSRYRPVIANAEPVSSQPLQVRYYYNY